MRHFERDARAFGGAKAGEREEARQRVAVRLICGVDLTEVMEAQSDRQAGFVRKLERLIERERLKGAHRHWSYDLNRHIALKQVLDRLRVREGAAAPGPARERKRRPKAP